MGYIMGASLSGLEHYLGLDPEDDEIYVLRLWLDGFPAEKSIRYPLDLVKAIGEAFQRWGGLSRHMFYNIRGVVLSQNPAVPGRYVADVICVWDGSPWYVPGKKAELMLGHEVADYLNQAEGIGRYVPGAVVNKGGWYYLTGDETKPEVSYWLSAPNLWDQDSEQTTLAWQQGQGVWFGTAEERQRQFKPPYVPPIPPPNGKNGKNGKDQKKKPPMDYATMGIVAVLAAVGIWAFRGRGAKT